MDDLESAVSSLPPSAKLVFKTLQYEGPMTQSQLADASLLPQRTVRHAVKKLLAVDVIEKSVYLMMPGNRVTGSSRAANSAPVR